MAEAAPARVVDAYRQPREIRPGCQHQLGCRCEPPFWLRPFSEAELARVERGRLPGEGNGEDGKC